MHFYRFVNKYIVVVVVGYPGFYKVHYDQSMTNHGRSFPTTSTVNIVAWTSCYVVIMIRLLLKRFVTLAPISLFYYI